MQNETNIPEADEPKDALAEDAEAEESQEEIQRLYEQSLKDIKEGEIIKGKIIQVDRDFVVVDIGYKSEGLIPINEFIDEKQNLNVEVGNEVDVLLERKEDEDGIIVLSKDKADKMRVWDKISKASDGEAVVEGRVISRVKGGLSVDIGVTAFLPGSQVDVRPIRDLDSLIGKNFKFRVLKFNKARGNIVLSRRALLEAERDQLKEQTLKSMEEGQVLKGIVKNVTEYGAFVDLGGIDGLLHITDMSWGRVSSPLEILSVGDTIDVKVLKYDPEKERVSLGLKQLAPDPWTQAAEKYPIGSRVQGRVVSLTDYGAFIELEKGIEGLIHIYEMSWTRKIKHPSKLLSVGDMVEVMVLDVDQESKRISLGLKQMEPNPWDLIEEKYPVGTEIEGKIRNITDFGIFIEVEKGIDGLVHISDLSWTQHIKHPSEVYSKGQTLKAVVLNIDKENQRLSLGVKQLVPDPWQEAEKEYEVGKAVKGEVTSITDFGIFIRLREGIEGLVHISELGEEKKTAAEMGVEVGDTIEAEVLRVEPKEKRIALSVRALEFSREKAEVQEFMDKQGKAVPSLGDLFPRELPEEDFSKTSAKEEAQEEVKAEETQEEVKTEEPQEEVKAEETQEEVKTEEPQEEVKAEETQEEVKTEEPQEEVKA
ncbi:MAG: 30S ribosomal protein S1, partial [Deltaproteobacteria bacterium]